MTAEEINYAKQRLEDFLANLPTSYREANLVFASYAAFPAVFSPDMLYQLWLFFQDYKKGEMLCTLPMVVVADLLQSGLCEEIAFELYEMDGLLAQYLRKNSQILSQESGLTLLYTEKDLAMLTLEYAERYYKYSNRQNLYDMYYWKSLFVIDPAKASQEIKETLQNKEDNKESSIRNARIFLQLAEMQAERSTDKPDISKLPTFSYEEKGDSIDITDKQLVKQISGLLHLEKEERQTGNADSILRKRSIYALLVGIDDYPIASHKLNGCVNDVNAMHEFLEYRCKSENTQLKVLKLLNSEATKANIVKGFLEHLSSATNNDDAFFYYSGHGAQEVAPPEFWQIEPDKLNESIVCVDSRTEEGGRGDLVDKETAYLFWKVSQKNPRILAVMDCGRLSSSIKQGRSFLKSDIIVRQIPVANKMRKIQDYLGYNEGFYQIRGDGQVMLKKGNYIVLKAARANEAVKETTLDGQKRGAFNFSLIETLKAAKGDLSYGDLMSKVKAKVISLVPEQNPQIEICVPTQIEGVIELASIDKTFLGGLPPKEDFLRIYYRDDLKNWVVNMGQMQGLPKNFSPSTPNILSIFNFTDTFGNKEYKLITDEYRGNDVARAIITKIEKDYSKIEFQDHPNRNSFTADTNAIYKAKLTFFAVRPTLFYMEGSDEDTQHLKKMLETDAGSQPYAKFTDNPAEAKYKVLASQDQFTKKYEFLLNQDGKKVCKDIKGKQAITPQNSLQVGEGAMAQKAWSYVQSIGKWEKILEMSNPDTSFSDNSVMIEVIDSKEIQKRMEEQIAIDLSNGLNLLANQEFEGIMITPDTYWRVKNNTSKQLYCTAIWMSQNFGADVTNEASLQIVNRPLLPNSFFDILDGSPINLTVNENLLIGGEFQEKIVIKLIYSTEEFAPDFAKNMTLTPLPFSAATLEEDSATRRLLREISGTYLTPSSFPNIHTKYLTKGLTKKASGADWSVFNLFITVNQPNKNNDRHQSIESVLIQNWKISLPSITLNGMPVEVLLKQVPHELKPDFDSLIFSIDKDGTYNIIEADLIGIAPRGSWAFDGLNTSRIILNPGNVIISITNHTKTTMTINYQFPSSGTIYASLGEFVNLNASFFATPHTSTNSPSPSK
jgi:hypothetical protein